MTPNLEPPEHSCLTSEVVRPGHDELGLREEVARVFRPLQPRGPPAAPRGGGRGGVAALVTRNAPGGPRHGPLPP
eukprot:3027655-Lingulodinium_polyedra.AAC.1